MMVNMVGTVLNLQHFHREHFNLHATLGYSFKELLLTTVTYYHLIRRVQF